MATKTEILYENIAKELSGRHGAVSTKMFGMPTLKINGKVHYAKDFLEVADRLVRPADGRDPHRRRLPQRKARCKTHLMEARGKDQDRDNHEDRERENSRPAWHEDRIHRV